MARGLRKQENIPQFSFLCDCERRGRVSTSSRWLLFTGQPRRVDGPEQTKSWPTRPLEVRFEASFPSRHLSKPRTGPVTQRTGLVRLWGTCFQFTYLLVPGPVCRKVCAEGGGSCHSNEPFEPDPYARPPQCVRAAVSPGSVTVGSLRCHACRRSPSLSARSALLRGFVALAAAPSQKGRVISGASSRSRKDDNESDKTRQVTSVPGKPNLPEAAHGPMLIPPLRRRAVGRGRSCCDFPMAHGLSGL